MSEDFEKVLIKWDKEPGRLSMTHNIARAMLNRTSPQGNEVVLDYGTGTGLIAREFYPSVKKIVAVDSSKEILTFLRKKLDADSITSIEPLAWSIGDDQQKLPRFDIIIVSLTLHHVVDITLAADVFYKLLNPGGTIAVADLDPDNGESHGPEMIVHSGFDRDESGRDIQKSRIHHYPDRNCCNTVESEFKDRRVKRVPHFPDDCA